MSGYDPTDIVGQERVLAEAQNRAKQQAQLEAADFKWIVSNKRGRRFIWRFLEKAGVFRSSFTGNSETFFREGSRNMGLQVLAMVHEHAPEAYTLMLSEQKEHERSSNERTSDH
jgi:hypothetical protein